MRTRNLILLISVVFTLHNSGYTQICNSLPNDNYNCYFNVFKNSQQGIGSLLCWAYCCQTVLVHYNEPISLDDIWMYGTGKVNDQTNLYGVNASKPTYHSVKEILNDLGNVTGEGIANVLLEEEIKAQIEQARPIIATLKYHSNPDIGHMVVIHGATKYSVTVMDPLYNKPARLYSYSQFVNDPGNTYWTHTLRLTNDPRERFEPFKLNPNIFKELSSEGGGYYNGMVPSCTPYNGDQGCTMGCSTNVHNITDMLWYGNTPGNMASYPISFPKEGVYKITLTCRGSICANEGPGVPGCDNTWKIYQVGAVATVKLSSSVNFIRGKTIISGADLDRIAYNGWENGNPIPFDCRAYTMKYKNVEVGQNNFNDYPMIEPGEIDIQFEAVIKNPGVENIEIRLIDGTPDITGLSIHKIRTDYIRYLLYGCNDPSADNYQKNADVNCCCIYTPPPPPPPYNYSFVGSGTHWSTKCYNIFGTPYTCDDQLFGFEIIWGDGKVDSYGNMDDYYDCYDFVTNQYIGQTFRHFYSKPGEYTPYVRFNAEAHDVWVCWDRVKVYAGLPEKQIPHSLSPIMLLLLD